MYYFRVYFRPHFLTLGNISTEIDIKPRYMLDGKSQKVLKDYGPIMVKYAKRMRMLCYLKVYNISAFNHQVIDEVDIEGEERSKHDFELYMQSHINSLGIALGMTTGGDRKISSELRRVSIAKAIYNIEQNMGRFIIPTTDQFVFMKYGKFVVVCPVYWLIGWSMGTGRNLNRGDIYSRPRQTTE